MDTTRSEIVRLKRTIARLLSTDAFRNKLSPADAQAVADARSLLLEGDRHLHATIPLHAYSSVSSDEAGRKYPAEIIARGTGITLNLGEEDSGATVMLEIREDAAMTDGPLPHGRLWIGVAPRDLDTCLSVLIDLENGLVTHFENPGSETSLSPLTPESAPDEARDTAADVEEPLEGPPAASSSAEPMPLDTPPALHQDTSINGRRFRHLKRGTSYTVLGAAHMQWSARSMFDGLEVIVYRGDNGLMFVRPRDEFEDGRFASCDE